MSRRGWWRLSFLGLTGLVLGMECFAAWDGNTDTDPWTELIVAYIPDEVAAVGIGGLSLWLMVHFGRRYLRKARSKEGTVEGG